MLHTFPFLIPNLDVALKIAYAVVAAELIAIAFIRWRFMSGNLWATIAQVIVRWRNRLRHRHLARPDRRWLIAGTPLASAGRRARGVSPHRDKCPKTA